MAYKLIQALEVSPSEDPPTPTGPPKKEEKVLKMHCFK